MDIDPDIASWVLEFLLKQPIEDRTLNSVLRILPLPKNNLNFVKLLLLKKLESEVSRSSISESMLEFLEQLEEIEFRQGNQMVSDAMKHAYCALAVECAVKTLANGDDGDNSSKFDFFEAVKRLWRSRIGRMQKVLEKGGLISEELLVWKDDIEGALWDDSICERVVNKSKGLSAVDAVSDYLKEEREKMGPSFLELVAAKVKDDDDDVAKEILGVGTTDANVAVEEAPSPSQCVNRVMDVGNVGNQIPKGRIQLRPKLLGLKHSRRHKSGSPQRAKIVDSAEVTVGPSHRNHNSSPSEVVNRVCEALQSNAVDLQAVVKEPLPDALQLAEAISDTERENEQHDPVKGNHVDSSRGDLLAVVQDPFPDSLQLAEAISGTARENEQHDPIKENDVEYNRVVLQAVLKDPLPDSLQLAEAISDTARENKQHDPVKENHVESNRVDLLAVVKDPLPDALQFAEVFSDTATENKQHDPVKENYFESNRVVLQAVVTDTPLDTLQLAEAISGTARENKQHDPVKDNHVESSRVVQAGCGVSNVQKPSLMERNNSAHTYEWSESIDEPEENEASRCKLVLPTPRTINIDPLKIYEMKKVQKRRKRRYWTVVEEDALRAGVQKFGKGNWKAILTEYDDIFDERTDGDLKDKWRNMTKC